MKAHFLLNKISSDCRIIVFEKEEKNVFTPSLLWLMIRKRKTKDVYSYTKQIAKKGIELVSVNVEKVNTTTQLITPIL